jgi:hypothetical protein
VPINFEEALKDVISTFEKKDVERFIKKQEEQQQEINAS